MANALEAGTAWGRIERFFLSAVEESDILTGVHVQVNGRLGECAWGMLGIEGRVLHGDLCMGQDVRMGQDVCMG